MQSSEEEEYDGEHESDVQDNGRRGQQQFGAEEERDQDTRLGRGSELEEDDFY